MAPDWMPGSRSVSENSGKHSVETHSPVQLQCSSGRLGLHAEANKPHVLPARTLMTSALQMLWQTSSLPGTTTATRLQLWQEWQARLAMLEMRLNYCPPCGSAALSCTAWCLKPVCLEHADTRCAQLLDRVSGVSRPSSWPAFGVKGSEFSGQLLERFSHVTQTGKEF